MDLNGDLDNGKPGTSVQVGRAGQVTGNGEEVSGHLVAKEQKARTEKLVLRNWSRDQGRNPNHYKIMYSVCVQRGFYIQV